MPATWQRGNVAWLCLTLGAHLLAVDVTDIRNGQTAGKASRYQRKGKIVSFLN
jgi:hypothetical protein